MAVAAVADIPETWEDLETSSASTEVVPQADPKQSRLASF